ncbi:MAG: penicillin-binding transpeptidase domain-containing protein, partial [Myxococcales bacterium]
EADRKAAEAEEVRAFPVEDVFKEFAPFFTEHVRRDIVRRYGNERLLTDGLQVFMTMHAERQLAAQVAMLDGLIRVDKRQGFIGPLLTLTTDAERAEFEKKIAKKLGDEKLTPGSFYVGYVSSIDEKENFALVNVGGQLGKLPIVAMRWARPPNPEKYYPSALIDHVKQALKPGDVIVVKAVTREALEDKDDPKNTRLIPKEGPFFTLEQEPTLQGALVSVDPSRGTVEAMIGGYDFDANEFNRAFQACRQPGSSFKPLIYSAAIEKLEWPVNKVLVDAPIVTDSEDTQLRWKPENFGGDFKGDVLMRSALINSMNIPAIKTLQAIGVKEAAAWAKQLGITTQINEDLSMALGGSCVHLWDLTNVYATFNQLGRKVQSRFVRKVEDRFGRTLEDHTSYDDPSARFEERIGGGYAKLLNKPEQVMRPETGFLITHLMAEVVQHGTGAPAQKLGKPAAGKTGTTNDSFDTWFMGMTKDLVTGVWMGYDRYDHPLGRYETGGRASLPTWLDYMKRALGERPQPRFEAPAGLQITWARIDPNTGKLAGPGTRQPVAAPFVTGTEPQEAEHGDKQVDPRQLMIHDY